ncbi:6,7-dimethyl-8-ribityllumazine synthase [soil metagenome]
MPHTLDGSLVAPADARFAIVCSRFNDTITRRLLDGALDLLKRQGVDDDRVTVAWCPGAFEIPVLAREMAETGTFDAVICLGAVIRGATTHYDYVAGGVAAGIAEIGSATGVPAMFGVLTVETIEQAIERSGTKSGNKGADVAAGAIEMVNVLRAVRSLADQA